jgi:hypothetical protein
MAFMQLEQVVFPPGSAEQDSAFFLTCFPQSSQWLGEKVGTNFLSMRSKLKLLVICHAVLSGSPLLFKHFEHVFQSGSSCRSLWWKQQCVYLW